MPVFSVIYWLFFLCSLPFLFVPDVLLWLVTVPFDRRRRVLHLYSCLWGSLYVWLNPLWSLTVEGRDRLPRRGPAVLVANHLSLLDILVLYGLFSPFKWVAKAELFRLPFVGWNMVLNDYVRIQRGDRESIRRMMAHCRAHLDRGMPVLIFPEGTRSADGTLKPFKDGAFRLACEAGCPVVPIAVSGTYAALPKHGLVLRERMRARVQVLPAIEPSAHGGDPARLRDACRAAIAAALPPEAGATGGA
jgi:1-acyl-sn-glycerol-3-phosphate acyltransferase